MSCLIDGIIDSRVESSAKQSIQKPVRARGCNQVYLVTGSNPVFSTMSEQQDYIDARMKEFAMNIDEFFVDQVIIDYDKSECIITDKTINSICVSIKAKHKNGVDCTQWFDMREFNKRFKKK